MTDTGKMAPVGWAYLPQHGDQRWHLCKDEPTAHSIREAVFLQSQVSAKDAEIERLQEERHVVEGFNALLQAEIERLRDGIAQALTELDAEHRPMWVKPGSPGYTTTDPVNGKDPIGCVMCYGPDTHWPCTTRLIADDLRELIEDGDQ